MLIHPTKILNRGRERCVPLVEKKVGRQPLGAVQGQRRWSSHLFAGAVEEWLEGTKVDGAPERRENWMCHSSLWGVLVPPPLPLLVRTSLQCTFMQTIVNWGPDAEALVRALLCNFWLHYMKTLIELMKQMEGMREERDDVACEENQWCWNTAYPTKCASPFWLFYLL